MLSFIEQIIGLYFGFMLLILAALVVSIGVSVWSWRVLRKPVLLVIFWAMILVFLSGGFFLPVR